MVSYRLSLIMIVLILFSLLVSSLYLLVSQNNIPEYKFTSEYFLIFLYSGFLLRIFKISLICYITFID